MLPARPMPSPPANAAPYVECLGAELALRFFLAFGGSEVTLAKGGGSGAVAEIVGPEAVARMADHWAIGHKVRVPLARKWTALMLLWQGHSTAEVARTIRAADATVRRWKKEVDG